MPSQTWRRPRQVTAIPLRNSQPPSQDSLRISKPQTIISLSPSRQNTQSVAAVEGATKLPMYGEPEPETDPQQKTGAGDPTLTEKSGEWTWRCLFNTVGRAAPYTGTEVPNSPNRRPDTSTWPTRGTFRARQKLHSSDPGGAK